MADYQTYLSTLYPHTTWSTTILTGGLVNATHRAVLLSGDAPSSLIIKHARPYVESAGPDLPFSTERQVRPSPPPLPSLAIFGAYLLTDIDV